MSDLELPAKEDVKSEIERLQERLKTLKALLRVLETSEAEE
jgi:hypothetical protein